MARIWLVGMECPHRSCAGSMYLSGGYARCLSCGRGIALRRPAAAPGRPRAAG